MKKQTSEELMLQIDNTIISLDIIESHFVCDLKKCLGKCCVLGDYGAPIEEQEIQIIEKNLDKIRPYMSPTGLSTIESTEFYTKDDENEYVTSLIDGKECVFVYFEENIAKCAIEKAYNDKKIAFQKPVSCHLYPIRIQKYNSFIAVNYNKWKICSTAIIKGDVTNIPVYRFLKDPLIRKFGKEWYEELEIAVQSL